MKPITRAEILCMNREELIRRVQELFPGSKVEILENSQIRIDPTTELPAKFVAKIQNQSSACFRCGRTSHWVEDC